MERDPQVPSLFRPLVKQIQDWVIDALQRRGIGSRYIDGAYIRGDLPAASLPAHASTHEDGGSDEIDVTGLTGAGGTPEGTAVLSTGVTDGHVLTADGAGGAAWVAPPAGGAVDAGDVSYTPTTAADWDGSADPGDVDNALDQLAERTADLEGVAGATELDDLTDVDTSTETPAEGDALIHRSGLFVPEAPVDIASDAAGITAVNLSVQGSDPSAPGADHLVVYAKGGGVYTRDSGGTVSGPFVTGHAIQDEGVALTVRSTLNFTGPGVRAYDSDSKSRVQVSRWEPLTDGEAGLLFTDDYDVIMCEVSS